MCEVKEEIFDVEEVIGFKLVKKGNGILKSPFTGMEFKVGEVKKIFPRQTFIANKRIGSIFRKNCGLEVADYTEEYDGLSGIFTDLK